MEKQAQKVKQEAEEKESSEKETQTQQCRRADGRGWRCPLPALPQQSMCEKHTRQRLLWEAKKREGFTNSRKGEVSESSRNGNGNGNGNNIPARKKKLNKRKQRELRNRLQAKKNNKKKLRWPSHLAPLEGIRLDLPNGLMVIPPLHGPALARALQKFGVRK